VIRAMLVNSFFPSSGKPVRHIREMQAGQKVASRRG
jgi:hypothetical protein